MPVHDHSTDDMGGRLELQIRHQTRGTNQSLYNNFVGTGEEHQVPLIFMIVCLSLLLLSMTLSMIMPSGVRNFLTCLWCRPERHKFNYIDAALYKTRHTMLRKEVYHQQMRTRSLRRSSIATANNVNLLEHPDLNTSLAAIDETENLAVALEMTARAPSTKHLSNGASSLTPVTSASVTEDFNFDVECHIPEASTSTAKLPVTKSFDCGRCTSNKKYNPSIVCAVSDPTIDISDPITVSSRKAIEANSKLNEVKIQTNKGSSHSSEYNSSAATITKDFDERCQIFSVPSTSSNHLPNKHNQTKPPAVKSIHPAVTLSLSADHSSYKHLPVMKYKDSNSANVMTRGTSVGGTYTQRARRILPRWKTCDSEKKESSSLLSDI